jgi:hypothetical protein
MLTIYIFLPYVKTSDKRQDRNMSIAGWKHVHLHLKLRTDSEDLSEKIFKLALHTS